MSAKSASLKRPDVSSSTSSPRSSCEPKAYPLASINWTAHANAVRLLPSVKGWFRAIPAAMGRAPARRRRFRAPARRRSRAARVAACAWPRASVLWTTTADGHRQPFANQITPVDKPIRAFRGQTLRISAKVRRECGKSPKRKRLSAFLKQPSGAGRQGSTKDSVVANSHLSIAEKFALGAPLALRSEFRPWSGLSVTSIYKEIAQGHLKLSKIGNKSVIAPSDALAWRDSKRVPSA
jgi:hypothetical protein